MVSIGEYPIISLKKAKNKRDECKSLLINNINPAQHNKETKQQAIIIQAEIQTFSIYFRALTNCLAPLSYSLDYTENIQGVFHNSL